MSNTRLNIQSTEWRRTSPSFSPHSHPSACFAVASLLLYILHDTVQPACDLLASPACLDGLLFFCCCSCPASSSPVFLFSDSAPASGQQSQRQWQWSSLRKLCPSSLSDFRRRSITRGYGEEVGKPASTVQVLWRQHESQPGHPEELAELAEPLDGVAAREQTAP